MKSKCCRFGGNGREGMNAIAAAAVIACAMMAAAFSPLPDPDWLEPSIQNEVEHALSRAYSATNGAFAASIETADTNFPYSSFKEAVYGNPSSNSLERALSKTDLAIRLVSLQRADGRWYFGTNDVTAAAIAILEDMLLDE